MKSLVEVTYQAGTVKAPQQTKLTAAAFTDTDKVHFPNGRLQTIRPYDYAGYTSVDFLGACRAIHGVENSSTGFYYLFGTNKRMYVLKAGNLTNLTPFVTSSVAVANSIATTDTLKTIVITKAAHGQEVGDRVKISGAADTGGILAASINIEHIITAVTTDTFSILTDTAATSTVASGGGASTVYYPQIAAGLIDQQFPAGYSGGEQGAGLYGASVESSAGVYLYPRTWSFDDFGNDVIMCPNDFTVGDGQKIYIWDFDLNVAPTVLTNAPTNCNFAITVNNAVLALCGNQIKISEIGNATSWTPSVTSTAYSKTLERVGRLTSAIRYGEKSAIVFSENECFLLRYVGAPDYWDISDLPGGANDGIIAPHACCEFGGMIFWRGRNNHYMFDGAYVRPLVNNQNGEWISQNINNAQVTKSFMVTDIRDGQIIFHFPAEGANEPSDYVIYNPTGNHFTLGKMDRTAAAQRFVGGRQYFANSVSESVSGDIFSHFLDDDSIVLGWTATTAQGFAGDGSKRFDVCEFVPDANFSGTFNLQYQTQDYPNGAMYSSSTYAVTSSSEWVTTRAAGRLRAIVFSGAGQMTLGKWREKIRMLGGR